MTMGIPHFSSLLNGIALVADAIESHKRIVNAGGFGQWQLMSR